MCGISGVIGFSAMAQSTMIQQMMQAMHHRGPDGNGVWTDPQQRCTLGHNRLAIIDLTNGGHQPFIFQDQLVLSWNGEIYNFRELRHFYQQKGYTFLTHSDTEVIAVAWAMEGLSALSRFEGMFAISLFDVQKHTLYLIRDVFGEKPLYYYPSTDGIAFASEIKAFWAAGLPRNWHWPLVLNYLTEGQTQRNDVPQQSCFENCLQVLPGCYIEINVNTLQSKQGKWQQQHVQTLESREDISLQFRSLLQQSVQLRQLADVPVGANISGGLDSSVIALAAAPTLQKCFSVQFPGFKKDESAYANAITQQLGLATVIIQPTVNDFTQQYSSFFHQHDEPIGSASVFAQYCLAATAQSHGIKVLLDGQGADELVGGYLHLVAWYVIDLFREGNFRMAWRIYQSHLAAHTSFPIVKQLLAAIFPKWAAQQMQRNALQHQQQQDWIDPAFRRAYQQPSTQIRTAMKGFDERLLHQTFVQGLPELLRYADRNSMAFGTEFRLPFLDQSLALWLLALPAAAKIDQHYTKQILRKAFKAELPPLIANRKDKVGFEVPQRSWLLHPEMQVAWRAAVDVLQQAHIVSKKIWQQPNPPQQIHAPDHFDWRLLCLGNLMKL